MTLPGVALHRSPGRRVRRWNWSTRHAITQARMSGWGVTQAHALHRARKAQQA